MTSNHDQEAFGLRFEDAVNESHKRDRRGMKPSPRAWETILAGLPEQNHRAETADPRALGPDPAPVSRKTQRLRKESGMDIALNSGSGVPPARATPGLFAWAAIVLAGVLIASSLFWFGQTPAGEDHNEVAWAPGIGTAESSPVAQANESACSVEPLTTDEVLETVLNPNKGYLRLGSNQAANSDSLWEPPLVQPPEFWHEEDLQPVDDPEQADQFLSMGNEFLACLQNGTSYQVWSFLDPIVVQKSIISEFPVLRSEADLRAYIESVGPEQFVDGNGSDLASLMRFNRSSPLAALDDDDALLFVDFSDRQFSPYGVGIIRVGAPGSTSFVYELYLTEISPDVWIVNDIGSSTIDD